MLSPSLFSSRILCLYVTFRLQTCLHHLNPFVQPDSILVFLWHKMNIHIKQCRLAKFRITQQSSILSNLTVSFCVLYFVLCLDFAKNHAFFFFIFFINFLRRYVFWLVQIICCLCFFPFLRFVSTLTLILTDRPTDQPTV